MIYHVLLGFANRNPDWLLRTHESLSLDPMTEIRELCQALALPWEPRLEERIRSFTSSGNPVDPEEGVAHSMRRDSAANIDRWKKLLSEDEAVRVRVASHPRHRQALLRR